MILVNKFHNVLLSDTSKVFHRWKIRPSRFQWSAYTADLNLDEILKELQADPTSFI